MIKPKPTASRDVSVISVPFDSHQTFPSLGAVRFDLGQFHFVKG
jgi:hypothetical protein